MVDLVALLEPPQNGDGVLHRRLTHVHLLEAPLQSGVLFDVGAELVQRGGADHAQLAPGQHGLDHVAGVHGPFGRPRPHNRVQFVHERDHLAIGVGDLLQNGLEPLLELPPVLGPGHHGRHVEGHQALVLQPLGHVTVGDAQSQALHDGGLAHAGLADQHRVVLGAPAQHLDGPADLLVPADHRIELAVPSQHGEVPPVLLQRLIGVFWGGGSHPMGSPHLGQRLQQLVAAHPHPVSHGQQQVLRRQEFVAQLGAGNVGGLHGLDQVARCADFGAVGRRQLAERGFQLSPQLGQRHPGALQHWKRHPVGLADQGQQEVVGGHLGVALRLSHGGGVVEGLPGLQRPPVGVKHQHAPRIA